jgi:hypothetical protein
MPRFLAEIHRSSDGIVNQGSDNRDRPPLARVLHLLPPRPLASLRVAN